MGELVKRARMRIKRIRKLNTTHIDLTPTDIRRHAPGTLPLEIFHCISSFEQWCWAAWFVGELIGLVSPIECTSLIVARKPAEAILESLLLVSVLSVVSRAGVA